MDTTQNIEIQDFTESEFLETMQIHNLLTESEIQEPGPAESARPKAKAKIRATGQIDFLDRNRSNVLLTTLKNLKHKTAVLLMMDCGLRVTECVTLQLQNFDFKRKVVVVKSLKKRGEIVNREIPLSTRLIETLAEYLKQTKPENGDSYLFPGIAGKDHISRKALNKVCDQIKKNNPTFSNLHPHTLRHTFATEMLANGAELHNVRTLLGHTSYNTTLIYNHTPIEVMRLNVENATRQKQNWLVKLWFKMFPKQSPSIINFSNNPQNFLIGREKELGVILDCINKNINTILLGNIGIGKSHLLKQLVLQNRKVLKLDEMANLKMTFVNMLLYLLENDKSAVKDLLFGDFDKKQIQTKLQKDSVKTLIEEIIKLTERHEYILMIDNVDGITSKAMKCIEELKDHFLIVTTARNIPINKANFLWSFERIEVERLSRTASLELINRLSYDMDIDDYELYRNHIHEQSNGNPRVIFELVERYRKEAIITDETIRSVRHIGGIPEIDMSFIIVIVLAGLTLFRYTSREVGGTNMRFIGGIALVLLMLARFFLSKTKRKFL